MPRSLLAIVASLVSVCAAFAGAPAPETFYALENGHGVSENCRLHTVDPTTGDILSSIQVTLAGYTVSKCNALARHPQTGVLYAIVRGGLLPDGQPSFLVTLDPATGSATFIRQLDEYFSALAFLANGMLVGCNGYGSTYLWALDPVTGAQDILGQLDESGSDFPGHALAAGPDGFVYHANGRNDGLEFFERIDLETPVDILTSHSYGLGGEGIQSLGWSSNRNQMFGTFYGTEELFTIDVATGVHTVVGNTGTRIKGLAFDGDTLYSLDNENVQLQTLDPDTAAVLTSIEVTLGGINLNAGNGLARQPGTGTLFAIVQNGGTGQRLLVTLDAGSGEATLIGDLGDRFAGLAFRDDGALVGITGFGANVPKSLYLIDTTTAATTFIREFPNGVGGEQAIAFATDGNLYHAAGFTDGSQYFERVNARHFTGFARTDIPHPFSLGDTNAPLALGWSANEGAMFMSAQDSDLYRLSPSSPAIVTPAASFPQHHKGLVFNGDICVAASADAAELIRFHVPTWQELTRVSVTSPGHTFVSILGMARAPAPPPTDGVPPPATDPIYVILREVLMPVADGGLETRFLATLDPEGFSGAATLIGELSDKFAGLAFRADGTLIGVTGSGASSPNALFTIDRATAGATFLMDLPNGTTGGQAIAIAPDGFLYHAAGNTASSFAYERIDLDALTIESVPLAEHRFDYREAAALGYSPALGAMHLSDHNGDLYTIDTTTGETALVGRFSIPVDSEPIYLMKGLAFAEEIVAPCPGDTNGDGVVDFIDLNNVLSSFGIASGQPGYIPGADVNSDDVVDFLDLNIVLSFFGTGC